MNCMKCGRKADEGNVFCNECLAVMAKYPVKATASVQLPRQKEEEIPKKSPRRKPRQTPEDQIARQKQKIRRMAFAIVGLCAVVCLLAAWIVQGWLAEDPESAPLGKNYTVQTDET